MEWLYSTLQSRSLIFFRITLLIFGIILVAGQPISAQLSYQPVNGITNQAAKENRVFIIGNTKETSTALAGTATHFIENVGQYGQLIHGYEDMGPVAYGYEGFKMPALITAKGILFLQRKIKGPSAEEKEEMEHRGLTEEEISQKVKITDRVITLEWVNANPNCQIVAEDEASGYFTYGLMGEKAHAFRKITCKEVYPGVDVEYFFNSNVMAGFEYNIILKPGSDISKLQLRWGGDVRKVTSDQGGKLKISTDLGSLHHSYPVSFYSGNRFSKADIVQVLEGRQLTFHAPAGYDQSQTLVIDPFISASGNLTGTNAGKAKDVDFDYAGNVYVTGGGDGNVYQLAKYNASGVWQWTFNGTLSIPSWTFGTYYGGWVVEKTTGNVYLGQGFNPSTGFKIIRINTAGLYDNYITTSNTSFQEDWKMYWSCNNGSPQILIAGGGTNSNINFGVCTPPSTILSSLNVTGIPYSTSTGWAQDIADIIIDPVSNDMYTIYGSLYGTPSLSNKIYKNPAPYSGATVSWSAYTGFTVVQEIANRPYMTGTQIENSCNVFAINSSYLFYWDGKNLKAINKATGAGVGTPLTIAANTALWSGGIIADECNNIFVGSTNGTIKVYKFNGSTFDDAIHPDISVSGFSTKSVYDLAFDEAKTLLYASGDGFVASFDVTAYNCSNTSYTITANPDCSTASVTSGISPAPPAGSIITYNLYDGSTLIGTNSTGTFTGLTPGITYTIIAFINQTCSGTSTSIDFFLPGPDLTVSSTNTLCGSSTGSITASGTGGSLPYSYSIDGTNFQGSGTFTALSAGVYVIIIKDAGGCSTTDAVTIINSNGPSLTAAHTDALCNNNNGTITVTGSGGVPPLSYSINGTTFQLNNFFTGLAAGTYTVTVQDSTGCLNETTVTINNTGGPTLSATPAATYCNSNNGKITAFASGGTSPLQYSIDGNNFQVSNIFTGLAPGVYTVTVQDANGCTSTVTVTVANSSGPSVTATTTAAACGNSNGTITANGSGGTAPLQYSINGVTFQSSNFFGGLTSGSYTITIKDANGCTSTVNATVLTSNAPTVTATSVSSSCGSSNGSVTATGSGGTPSYTYSINGINFQASGFFSGLAPGSYTILVKDALGCIGATLVTVTNTAGPSVSAVVTPASCGANDGIIAATGSGGTGLLQYSLNSGTYQVSGTFSGLASGTYTVTVKDANGCISTITVILSNASGLTAVASSIATPCSGSDGIITITTNGGVGALQYSIDGINFQSSNIFTGVAAGSYTITVTDANGCTVNASVTVTTVFSPTVSATVTNANCTSSNGIITASGAGGNPPYTYSLDGVNFQSSNVFSGLAPGVYTITVMDDAGCTGTTNATIINVGAGPPPSIIIIKADNIPCDGSGDLGEIKVDGTGGTGPYEYSFEGGPFSDEDNWDIAEPGTYTVTIMDANGCTATVEVVIEVDVAPGLTAVVTNADCGSSNGIIVASGSGGVPPYKYSLNGGPFQSSGTFSGLAPGIYTITIKDDEGDCKPSIEVIVLSDGGPTLSVVATDATCGLINGSIVGIGSGTAPLTYSLNSGAFQASGSYTGLGAGDYTLLIKDGTGCLGAAFITLSAFAAPTLNAAATGTSCGQQNGTITANASGGSGSLQYSLNGTTYQSSGVFTGLASGNYTVWVMDPNGCFATAAISVPATSNPNVTAYAIPASCGSSNGTIVGTGSGGTSPYLYSTDGVTFQSSSTFTGLAAGAYTITIKDFNDCVNSITVTVPNLSAPTLATSTVSAKCGNANGSITGTGAGGTPPLQYSIDGVNFQSSGTFSNVAPGTYTITVQDNNGCITTKLVTVANVAGPATLTATILAATCGNVNGKITAAASGGTSPLTYSLDGSTYQAGTVFNSVAAGTYTLYVKDNNGCIKTITVTVPNLEGPLVSANPTPSSCYANDGTITAIATGGTIAITYSKDGSVYQASNIFTGLAPGTYTISAKDANGCISTTTVTVGSLAGPTVTATTSLSGCGDGAITANATGGTPGYEYSLDGTNFQTSNVFDCLPEGSYTVTVKDENGCISTVVVDVTNVLPIVLIYLTAHASDEVIVLDWATDSEINNDYFVVERRKPDNTFETIDTVDGAGNSLVRHFYSLVDDNPYTGTNYYRLKQTDFNGVFNYSVIVSADIHEKFYFHVFPNPAGELVTLVTDQFFDAIFISDMSGRVLLEFRGNFENKSELNLSSLASGCYLLKATSGHGTIRSVKLIKSVNDSR